ncbi:MAG: hypothetical protein HYV32_02605 [Candidatus Kerfeldbacteria bacterium]|nr:hypothetical protein [Candidatus Kerfeldbacteria bacterium]
MVPAPVSATKQMIDYQERIAAKRKKTSVPYYDEYGSRLVAMQKSLNNTILNI